jgi:hypothetical protein
MTRQVNKNNYARIGVVAGRFPQSVEAGGVRHGPPVPPPDPSPLPTHRASRPIRSPVLLCGDG